MRKASLRISICVAVLIVNPVAMAADVYWDDGGSHLINDSTYQSDSVYLDYNMATPPSPGTHVYLVDGGSVERLHAKNNAHHHHDRRIGQLRP